MDIKNLKELAVHAINHTAPSNFSIDNVEAALHGEICELASSVNQFMKNRYDIYEIIVQAADEYVPNKVIDAVGIFAELKSVPQGQKAIFKRKLGKARAKQFLTRVGLSGLYETFRLDTDTFEVSGHAIGGAVAIDFERYLDGAESITELMNIIVEAQVDAVYVEVQRALRAAIDATARPTVNKYSGNTFVADEMLKLINIVKAYGSGAVIFAPPEFVAAMGADAIVPVGTNYAGIYSPKDIDAIHDQGYINIFRGTPIVQIPQSFVDENNNTTWIDPQMAYIFPTGQTRIVKVVFEGGTQIWDFKNPDNSMEIHTYRKLGVAIVTHHNWCMYQNTGITQTFENPYSV